MTDKELTVSEVLTNCFCKQCGCEASSNGYCKGKCAAMDKALTALTEIIEGCEPMAFRNHKKLARTNPEAYSANSAWLFNLTKGGFPLNNKGGEATKEE